MSGIAKSIGKVFKKVIKVVKKIAPYAILAAAVFFTGGAALAALGPAAGATFAGGPLAGALVSSGAAITGGAATTGGGIVAALGGLTSGAGSLLTKAAGSGLLGSALSGAAQGYMQSEMAKDQREFIEQQQKDRTARYNIDDASLFGVGPQARADISTDQGAVQGLTEQGLGIRTLPATSPVAYQPTQLAAAPTGPPRPSVGAPRQPKYRYNPETGTIDYG